jgi:hypothetical protein
LPEPVASDSPRYLFDEIIVDEAQVAEIQRELGELAEMRELFGERGWELLVERARRREREDLAALETCNLRDVNTYRARLGWWRWVIDLPANIAEGTENLQTRLAQLQPPDNEEDS